MPTTMRMLVPPFARSCPRSRRWGSIRSTTDKFDTDPRLPACPSKIFTACTPVLWMGSNSGWNGWGRRVAPHVSGSAQSRSAAAYWTNMSLWARSARPREPLWVLGDKCLSDIHADVPDQVFGLCAERATPRHGMRRGDRAAKPGRLEPELIWSAREIFSGDLASSNTGLPSSSRTMNRRAPVCRREKSPRLFFIPVKILVNRDRFVVTAARFLQFGRPVPWSGGLCA